MKTTDEIADVMLHFGNWFFKDSYLRAILVLLGVGMLLGSIPIILSFIGTVITFIGQVFLAIFAFILLNWQWIILGLLAPFFLNSFKNWWKS